MGEATPTLSISGCPEAGGGLLDGKYRVQRLLGRGGMGTVLLARHEALGREVAVKILARQVENQELAARLLREACALAGVSSDHVVRVLDVGFLEARGPYLVMEYLEGCSLGDLLEQRGPLPISETVDYLLQALEALAEVHGLGIIHRDLKPSNLFLARRPDGTRTVKVLDFGVSKVRASFEPAAELTASQAILGTPLYMSPEQLCRSRDVDARADIWSLGVVLYKLLTGQAPFAGHTVAEICFGMARKAVLPPRRWRKEIPRALQRVILRCLRWNRADRFQDATSLARALAPFGREGRSGRTAAPVGHTWLRRLLLRLSRCARAAGTRICQQM